jgi:hypothetical protein
MLCLTILITVVEIKISQTKSLSKLCLINVTFDLFGFANCSKNYLD